MKRLALVMTLAILTACGSNSTPTAPTQPTTPTVPTVVALTGTVTSAAGAGISGAAVVITDGANAGKSATSGSGGSYRIDGLTSANANVSANASGFEGTIKGVFINGTNTLNFSLAATPPPIWSRTGSGVNVFDMPLYVRRVRIIGIYNGSCQNFVVKIAGRLIVNEILGTCSVSIGSRYDGTSVTTGGVTEITNASGVQWSFEELR